VPWDSVTGSNKPEDNADVTANHTANDTSNVNGLPSNHVSGWAHPSDTTYIHGGKIYANSITLTNAANDFHLASINGNADDIPEGTTNKFAAESGADVTASHTANNTSYVASIPSGNVAGWAHSSDTTYINGGQIYTQSITTVQLAADAVHASQIQSGAIISSHISAGAVQASHIDTNTINASHIQSGVIQTTHIAANAVQASQIYTPSLSALSANLGQVIAGDIVGVDIRTATSGQRVSMDSDGLRLETGATTFTYGDSSHTYGDSTRKYGSGVLAYVLHPVKSIPFYINEEQSVADFHFYDRSSDPTGEAEDGDTCYSGGEFKVCTSGGTPGVFSALAYADMNNVEATDVLNKVKSVDGSGSGLDADLVRGLDADFTASQHTNGYQKLPGGLILQWGVQETGTISVTPPAWVTASVVFPLQFPNNVFAANISFDNSGTGDFDIRSLRFKKTSPPSTTGFDFDFNVQGVGTTGTAKFHWIAIGN